MADEARAWIDGATRLLVFVGDPVAQARSPAAFTQRLAELGRPAIMVPWHVSAAAFPTAMAGLTQTLNLDGIVVTYPHKASALSFAAQISRRAAQVGAANALRRGPDGGWIADMFDGIGLLRAAERLAGDLRGQSVKLLGAGAAASAIAFAFADAGVAAISIHDRDDAKARALAERVRAASPGCAAGAGDDRLGDRTRLLINATTVGLAEGDPMPAPLDELTAATSVIDIVPRADGTALLAHARARGCRHAGGVAMVDGQRDALLEFFGLAS